MLLISCFYALVLTLIVARMAPESAIILRFAKRMDAVCLCFYGTLHLRNVMTDKTLLPSSSVSAVLRSPKLFTREILAGVITALALMPVGTGSA